MRKLSQERSGELFILAEAIIWGVFPLLALKSYSSISPIFSVALCQIFSLPCLFIPTWYRGDLRKVLQPEVARLVLASTLLVGVIFYALVFIATKYSDPVTISILLLLEVPATYLVLRALGKEKLSWLQMLGGLLVLSSAFLTLYKGVFSLQLSHLLVVLAVFFAPLGNYYNKKARSFISSTTFVFLRNTFSSIFLLLLAFIFEGIPKLDAIVSSLPYVIPNGLLVFGLSKIFWVEGLHRISVGKAISLNAIFPIFTMLAAYIMLSQTPSIWQLLAMVPAMLGICLLTRRV